MLLLINEIQSVPELRVPKQTLITFLFFDLENWYSGLMNFIDIHFDIRNYFGTLKAKNISYDYRKIFQIFTYYWFWGACETHLSKTKPDSIEQVMEHVNDYAASVPREQVDKAVMDILVRARCCLDCGGGSFEPRLKSFKRKNT